MEIIDINRGTLINLYEQFPESLKDLSMNGKYLIYLNEKVDISNFNINDLLSSNGVFFESLSVLSSEDIFKIIKLHAIRLNSCIKEKQKEDKDTNANNTNYESEHLISEKEFYSLLSTDIPFNEKQQKEANDYYSFLRDLSLYEDFLIPDLRQEIIKFRNYAVSLEYENSDLNIHQVDSINKLREFENKDFSSKRVINDNLATDNSLKLTLQKDKQKAGYSGTLELVIFSLVFASALTIITLYLLH